MNKMFLYEEITTSGFEPLIAMGPMDPLHLKESTCEEKMLPYRRHFYYKSFWIILINSWFDGPRRKIQRLCDSSWNTYLNPN